MTIDIDDRRLRRTLQRCRGQFARPIDVGRDEEKAAIDRGYLKFHEWPSGHYAITEKGRNFLFSIMDEDDA